VKTNDQFIIPFKGLKEGKHSFVFEVDDWFFDDFEGSEITKGEVHIEVELDKKATMLLLNFDLTGTVFVACDRCLDDLEMQVDYQTELFVKFGDETEEQTEEILVLSHHEFELDVTQHIYEFIHLSLPYKRVHPNDKKGKSTCNAEMIKKLDEYIIHESDNDNDPRWDGLKNLLNN
jgi:uncharacterized protein